MREGPGSPEAGGEGVPAGSTRLPSAGPAPGENTSLCLININCRAPGFRTLVSIFLLFGEELLFSLTNGVLRNVHMCIVMSPREALTLPGSFPSRCLFVHLKSH